MQIPFKLRAHLNNSNRHDDTISRIDEIGQWAQGNCIRCLGELCHCNSFYCQVVISIKLWLHCQTIVPDACNSLVHLHLTKQQSKSQNFLCIHGINSSPLYKNIAEPEKKDETNQMCIKQHEISSTIIDIFSYFPLEAALNKSQSVWETYYILDLRHTTGKNLLLSNKLTALLHNYCTIGKSLKHKILDPHSIPTILKLRLCLVTI